MKIVDWLTFEESEGYEESIGGLGGWFNWNTTGHRWKDYLEHIPKELIPYAEAIRERVLENNLHFGGNVHQQTNVPLFDNNTVGSFSYRAWGDIMAAIWSEAENKDYSYMDFYMTFD